MTTLADSPYQKIKRMLAADQTEMDIERGLPSSIGSPSEFCHVNVQKVLMLYNPESGNHYGETIMHRATYIMRRAMVLVNSIPLERKGHAEEILSTISLEGIDVVCAVGGDGTFHECVNGMMKRNDSYGGTVPLAMIPGGTGNSFSLEIIGDTSWSHSVYEVLRGISCPIDVAKLTFPQVGVPEEKWQVIYSFNSIHWGLASKVSALAEKWRWMKKAVRYTAATLVEIFGGHKIEATIEMQDKDGKILSYREPFCLLIANNIISAAKGMKMAPCAKLNDGLIDLIIVRSNRTRDLMAIFRKVYEGTHTQLDQVEYRQVKWFSVTTMRQEGQIEKVSDPHLAEEIVDIDGELKGSTPFVCTMIPKAIRIIV